MVKNGEYANNDQWQLQTVKGDDGIVMTRVHRQTAVS